MKKSVKSKSDVHTSGQPGRGYPQGPPAGSPPPQRSSDPSVANTPSPGGPKYEGNVGDNPKRSFNAERRKKAR
jgi:hypothetical protein